MKYILHIPTEQYGFIAIEIDSEQTPDSVAEIYREHAKAFAPKPVNEMERNRFNECLDRYINEGKMNADDYAEMGPFQQSVVQEIKKSKKRTN